VCRSCNTCPKIKTSSRKPQRRLTFATLRSQLRCWPARDTANGFGVISWGNTAQWSGLPISNLRDKLLIRKAGLSMYRTVTLPLTIFLVFWLAACGSGAGHHNTAASSALASGNGFLYVSDSTQNDIFGFRIDNFSGTLTAVAGSPFPATGGAPGRLAVDHTQRFLFGLSASPAALAGYLIDGQVGTLTASGSVPVDTDPHSLATHPSANFVYVLSGNAVTGFSFDSNGLLTALPNSRQVVSAPATQGIAIDSTGTLLFITLQSGLSAYQIGTDGSLTLLTLPNLNAGLSPIHLATDPVANLIFSVGNTDASQGGLFGWAFNGGVGLNVGFTPAPGTPVAADTTPVWVTVVPSGAFVYVAAGANGNGQILGYSLSAAGQPVPVGGSFPVTPNPAQLVVDPSGSFLYSMNVALPGAPPVSASSNFSGFLIGQAGALTAVSVSAANIASPGGMAISRK